MRSANTARHHIDRFLRHDRGTSAIEFAFVLPLLLIVYFGGVELSHTVTVDRKVTSAASAVGDLVAQGTNICDDEMQDIFLASQTILAPYDASHLKIVVSSIEISRRGDTVLWSDSLHGSKRSEGSSVVVPEAVRLEGSTLIMAEVEYEYIPTLGQMFTDSFRLTETFYMRPRAVDTVFRSSCAT